MKSHNSGFTLPEMVITLGLIFISLGVVLNTYLYSERYFKAGTSQVIAVGNARAAFRKISNYIRRAVSVSIYKNYGPTPSVSNPGNYIEIDMPAGADVGYYLNANNQIRYIPNLAADNKSTESDDILIATNIYGSNIFKDNGGIISLAFTGFSAFGPGYHGVDVRTYAKPRN